MNIQFMGAAQTVTGSCYIIEAEGMRFAVDCGMHQGHSDIEKRNQETLAYRPAQLDFILLTHAHIDHSGLLPRIVRDGFNGPIYCTPPTADLVTLMLEDSGHIQEVEASWRQKKQSRTGSSIKDAEPLYTVADALKVPEHLQTVEYDQTFEPKTGISVRYRNAGHILGSAFLEITITEKGKPTRIVFSGDLGRPGTLLMHHAAVAEKADYLVIESTYGDRDHKNEEATLDELVEAIQYAYSHNEKVIIPAFAVGRTQEILYSLLLLHKAGKLPRNIPVYVDSPLAIRATEVFKKHKKYLAVDECTLMDCVSGEILLPNLHFTLTADESQVLNNQTGPAIVIAASGMCNAGRIRHHLRHNIWKSGASIVFVGYQGVGTPGRAIVDGAKSLRLFGEDLAVKAKIFTIGGFSAHAGQSQLLDWVRQMTQPSMRAIIVHGETKAQETFAALLKERFGLESSIPGYLEEMQLAIGTAPVVSVMPEAKSQRFNWSFLIDDTNTKIEQLRTQLATVDALPWDEQVALRDRVLDLNKELLSVLTHFSK